MPDQHAPDNRAIPTADGPAGSGGSSGSLGPHDPAAWQRLVQLHGPTVYGLVRRSGVPADEAAAAVETVFREAAARWSELDRLGPDALPGWLRELTGSLVPPPAARPGQTTADRPPSPNDTPQFSAPSLPAEGGIDPFALESQQGEALARAVEAAAPSGEAPSAASGMAAGVRPRQLGHYHILEELGHGGMGHVYKARHTKLHRLVAVKILPGNRLADPRATIRFEREMMAVGQLDHPNIVRAIDAGEVDRIPFLVMEYLDGLHLADVVRRHGPLGVPDACELVRQAALGLQCAHEHGLVHRDIKPWNLMLTRDGQVKVLDLGLARFQAEPEGSLELTSVGQAVGTADYMAPEQASDSHTVDIRADIYALGCTLYKLLAGRPPFGEPEYRSRFDKMLAHKQAPVPPIRLFRADVPGELVEVLDRTLAKDPAERFSTPAELAEALAPLSEGADPVGLVRQLAAMPATAHAMPGSDAPTGEYVGSALTGTRPSGSGKTPSSIGRPARRRRVWTLAAAAVALLAVVVGLFALGAWLGGRPGGLRGLWARPHERPAPEQPREAPEPPEPGFDGGVPVPEEPPQPPAEETTEPGESGEASSGLPEEPPAAEEEPLMPGEPSEEPPGEETGEETGKQPGEEPGDETGDEVGEEPGDESSKEKPPADDGRLGPMLEEIPDRPVLATPGGPLSPTALVRRPAPLEGLRSWTLETRLHRGPVYAVDFRWGDRLLVTAGADGAVRIWDLTANTLLRVLVGTEGAVRAVAWSPGGHVLATAGDDRLVRLWDPRAGRVRCVLDGHEGHVGRVLAVAWSPDGRTLASAGEDRSVRLWDVRAGSLRLRLPGHEREVQALAWSADGSRLASASPDGGVKLWDPESGSLVVELDAGPGESIDVAFSPADGLVATAVAEEDGPGAIALWEPDSGRRRRTLANDPGGAGPIAFSPDGRCLAAAGAPRDGSVRVWDTATGNLRFVKEKPSGAGAVHAVAYSGDGQTLALGDFLGRVELWADSGERQRSFAGQLPRPSVAAFSLDERTMAVAYPGGAVRLWQTTDGAGKGEILTGLDAVDLLVVSPDGKRIAACEAAAGVVRALDAATGKRVGQLAASRGPIHAIAFSPDGRTLAVGSREVELWDPATESAKPQSISGYGNGLGWSPDGDRLAVGRGGDVLVYPGGGGRPLRTLRGPRGDLCTLAWDPEGRMLAAAGGDAKVYVWETETARLRKTLDGFQGPIRALGWLADAGGLAVAGEQDVRIVDPLTGHRRVTIPCDPAALAPRAGLVVARGTNTLHVHQLPDGRLQYTVVPLRNDGWLAITPTGQYHASPNAAAELIAVIATDGGQSPLTLQTFATRYHHENDAATFPKINLPDTPEPKPAPSGPPAQELPLRF